MKDEAYYRKPYRQWFYRHIKPLLNHISQRKALRRNLRYCNEHPYRYDAARYPDNFLAAQTKADDAASGSVPQRIVAFWTGHNAMSADRAQHLSRLQQQAGVDVLLVTPDNLAEHLLPGYPLHEAYPYLSLVHKADYLRCYFMHHYGGGYSDVKAPLHDWREAFARLESSNAYAIGYPEDRVGHVTLIGGVLGEDMRTYFSALLGNCAYIFRPDTPFTREWYTELHRRLDGYLPELRQHPGNIMGDNEGYPIPWFNILGDIFHPLCLKYMDKTLKEPKLRPSLERYR